MRGRLQSPSWSFHRFCQLQQVMNRTDQTPFAADFLDTAQQELPEASGLFDLTEYGLDGLLAQPIATPARGACELRTHRCYASTPASPSTPRGGVPMSLPAGGHVRSDLVPGKDRQVTFGTISGISRELARLPSGVGLDLFDDRGELLHIGGRVRQTLRDNDLRVGVHRRLPVVGLREVPTRLHDVALHPSVPRSRGPAGERSRCLGSSRTTATPSS
jgi:hypothetical protein